jgi:hypothetical protein
MKRTIILLFLTALAGFSSVNASSMTDTTIIYHDKIIDITDNADGVNVKVASIDERQDTVTYKPVFEGLYSDSKSFETWTVVEDLGIQIPLITSKKVKAKQRKSMKPHWAGFGYGISTITDGHNNFNTIGNMDIDLSESNEYTYNAVEHITPIFYNILGITTGLGITWRNYYLANEDFYDKVDGLTTIAPGAVDCHYKYSRLHTVHITIPVLLEFQPIHYTKRMPYLAAGVIGSIKTSSYTKTKYTDADGSTIRNKERGVNVPPVSLDYIAKAGIGNWSVYAKYSPFSIFEKDKGPDVHHASIGLMIDL